MVKPKIGLSALYCLNKPLQKMITNLPWTRIGYAEVVDEGLHTLDKRRTLKLKNIGESHGVKYSVHAPFADINIASLSKVMRKTMLKRLKKSIIYASELDAYVWVFHPGLKTGLSMFYPRMDWLQNLETVQWLCKTARDYGVKIAIENMPEPYPFLMKSVKDFTEFYDEIGENVGLVLDIGHANINRQIENFVVTFSDRIVHVHAHDNDGENDQHLGIGFGTVNWNNTADLLKKIQYNNPIIIESVDHIEESLQKLKYLFS